MSEIPIGILEEARAIAAEYWTEIGLTDDAAEIMAGECDKSVEIALATRAIMAERSRCEKIAKDRADHIRGLIGGADDDEEAAYISGKLDEANRIAAAIRKTA